MRLKMRSSVDLPQPDGPMKAVTRLVPSDEVDVLQRMVLAVIEVEVARGDLRGGIGTRHLRGDGMTHGN